MIAGLLVRGGRRLGRWIRMCLWGPFCAFFGTGWTCGVVEATWWNNTDLDFKCRALLLLLLLGWTQTVQVDSGIDEVVFKTECCVC